MLNESIPSEITRFILTSIESVPHLEAILLLCSDPKLEWDARMMAQRLFMSEKKADEILADLRASGFTAIKHDDTPLYRYAPISPELKDILDRLAKIYPKNLVEVSNLIHSKTSKQAKQLGDAFKWQKEKD